MAASVTKDWPEASHRFFWSSVISSPRQPLVPRQPSQKSTWRIELTTARPSRTTCTNLASGNASPR